MKDEGSGSEGVMGMVIYQRSATVILGAKIYFQCWTLSASCCSAVSDQLPRRSSDPKNQSDLATLDMVSLPVPVISICPLFFFCPLLYSGPVLPLRPPYRPFDLGPARRCASSSMGFHPLRRTDPSLHHTLSGRDQPAAIAGAFSTYTAYPDSSRHLPTYVALQLL